MGHSHLLGHAGVHQVPDRRAPEVMAQHPRAAGLLARACPRLPEVAATRTGSMTAREVGEEIRDDAAGLALDGPDALELLAQKPQGSSVEIELPALEAKDLLDAPPVGVRDRFSFHRSWWIQRFLPTSALTSSTFFVIS
jgi:hypothetical protein